MTQSANPLKQYFRQPAIYLQLPSKGNFWPEKSINMPANGELPVLPMTAIDEITYRTPDALFNGQAVVSVIQSCIPSIKDAWQAPTADIDALLVAIKIASYGHSMDFGTTCPNCKHETDYALDLRTVLDQMKSPDFDTPIIHGDLEIRFQPIHYKTQHDINQQQFEQQRKVQLIPGSDLPEEQKLELLAEAIQRITEITIDALKFSVSSIRTPSAIVTDPEHINEFLKNCDRQLFNEIKDRVVEMRQSTELKPLHFTCGECQHEYDQPLTLDMASFFAPAS
jgi:hypothetical protein